MQPTHSCFFEGPESGALSNTKQWKKLTPYSYYSPFIAQGDVGFLSYKGKKYGQFFVAVQTFSKRIFALPISNLKTDSFVQAIQSMLKVRKGRGGVGGQSR